MDAVTLPIWALLFAGFAGIKPSGTSVGETLAGSLDLHPGKGELLGVREHDFACAALSPARGGDGGHLVGCETQVLE